MSVRIGPVETGETLVEKDKTMLPYLLLWIKNSLNSSADWAEWRSTVLRVEKTLRNFRSNKCAFRIQLILVVIINEGRCTSTMTEVKKSTKFSSKSKSNGSFHRVVFRRWHFQYATVCIFRARVWLVTYYLSIHPVTIYLSWSHHVNLFYSVRVS